MGILQDPYQRIGFYSGSLLRAARLVVDTGLHAFGWSRDKAIEYMVDNTGWARPILESQVDRYVKSNTVKSRAVDRSTIQIWNFLAKGHSTYYISSKFHLHKPSENLKTCN